MISVMATTIARTMARPRGDLIVIPVSAVLAQIANLIATDVTELNAIARVNVHLAQAPFTPGPGLTLGALTEATFNTYAAIAQAAGVPNTYTDPATEEWLVQLLQPIGGWQWSAGSLADLPQTIYGWYVTDNANANLFYAELFAAPVTLAAIGNGVNIDQVNVRLSQAALS